MTTVQRKGWKMMLPQWEFTYRTLDGKECRYKVATPPEHNTEESARSWWSENKDHVVGSPLSELLEVKRVEDLDVMAVAKGIADGSLSVQWQKPDESQN